MSTSTDRAVRRTGARTPPASPAEPLAATADSQLSIMVSDSNHQLWRPGGHRVEILCPAKIRYRRIPRKALRHKNLRYYLRLIQLSRR
ncbi:hypothetical protein Ntsu_48400 [Nocardia sp. IFM 10818]